MTVKKRLAVSNIIMIVIPVVITLLVGCVCLGGIYLTLHASNGFGFESSGDFYTTSVAVSDKLYEIFEHGSSDAQARLKAIGNIIDKNTTYVQVYENGNDFYTVGNETIADRSLMESVKSIGSTAFVSSENTQVYYYTENSNGNNYEIYMFSSNNHKDNNSFRIVLVISAVAICAAIVLSIIFTNRFLTAFVFKKIEQPLDILSNGVKEIGNGNLSYRLEYSQNDEFLPVCTAFNDMAVRLKKSVELAEKNEENRKELLLDISHDLRSPLTSIQAYVEGLSDGVADTPEMQKKYLETIKRKTCDIEKMVSSLFAYSKLDMEEMTVNCVKTPLPDAIEEIVGGVRDEYAEKGLDITVVPNNKINVLADDELLLRIVSNVLDNSLKYKNKEKGNVIVSVCREDGFAKIELADDGPGVDEKNLDKLFEVFYRTDKARSDTGNGNGIGLAFVKKAVMSMGGSVSAKRSAEGGLSIIIYLRCCDE